MELQWWMDFDRPSASDSAILADFLELQSRDPQFIHKRRQRAAGPIVLQGSTTNSTTNIPTGTNQCLRKRLECWGPDCAGNCRLEYSWWIRYPRDHGRSSRARGEYAADRDTAPTDGGGG